MSQFDDGRRTRQEVVAARLVVIEFHKKSAKQLAEWILTHFVPKEEEEK